MIKRAIAASALAAMSVFLVPSAQSLADGAASTRNIILGIGAATYLIIQHNRKVHERYAEDARRQADLQAENNNVSAAYSSERTAYANSRAEVTDLQREVAYQHRIIVQQRSQLSGLSPQMTANQTVRVSASQMAPGQRNAAMVSYGWGQL